MCPLFQNHSKDPSGHCVLGSDDYDECIAWAKKIEKEYANVKIVTCIGENSVDSCKGWTASELGLLYEVLGNFDFDISSANIKIFRAEGDGWPGETEPLSPGNYQISIADLAWKSPPSGSRLDAEFFQLFSSANNFKGTFTHELTHVAIDENPWLLDKWISATSGTWMGNQNFFIGSGYNSGLWDNLDERRRQAELVCMVNASLLYNGWWNNPLGEVIYPGGGIIPLGY